MSVLPRVSAVAGALVAALVLPAAAGAATKVVTMGIPADRAQSFQERYQTDVNAFFPNKVTVRVGDKVAFVPQGFHNADVPARGEGGLPLLAPTGQQVAGATDAAGAPFWFNGQPELGFNPELAQPNFGKTVRTTGAERVNSGLPLGERLRPFVVRFDRAGTYTVLCDVHPGMRATVRVVPKGRHVPSRRADARRVDRQVDAAMRVTRRIADAEPPAGTVDLGVAGPGGVERLAMVPATITVSRGSSVTFRMTRGSYEVHTATFGPGNPASEPTSYLGALAASFEQPVVSPLALYPSDAPGTPSLVTATTHGNGFFNTGVLDRGDETPFGADATVQFPETGTFTYWCLVHPFMRGEVVVR